MEWDAKHIRAAGMVVDPLRNRWNLATLYALQAGPMRPGEIKDLFHAAEAANAHAFGIQPISRECVVRHLGYLYRVGLVEGGTRRGTAESQTRYRHTPLAGDLLVSLGGVEDYGETVYPMLVRQSRAERHRDTDRPIPAPIDDGVPVAPSARIRRRASVLIFGLWLRPVWSFTILASLSTGPARTADLRQRINTTLAANRDVLTSAPVPAVGTGSLSRPLAAMNAAGLIAAAAFPADPDPHRPPGRTVTGWALTSLGTDLLYGLEPVAAFGTTHDHELAVMARVRAEAQERERRRTRRQATEPEVASES